MNRRIRIRTYGGVEAEFGRLDSAIRFLLIIWWILILLDYRGKRQDLTFFPFIVRVALWGQALPFA